MIRQGNYPGDVIFHEAERHYSRDAAKYLAGDGAPREIKVGTVIAKRTEDGKIVPLDPAGNDGSEVAVGIAYRTVTVPDGEDLDDVIVIRHAILKAAGLVWPDGITDAVKKAALDQLEERGILVRDSA